MLRQPKAAILGISAGFDKLPASRLPTYSDSDACVSSLLRRHVDLPNDSASSLGLWLERGLPVPRLAIVISAFGGIESLEGTLVSVLENRPADCEILVALDKPYDDPYELRGEVRLVEAPRRSSFVACINRALAATRSPFVHLLSSGCTVTEGWTEPALACFGDRRVASVSPVVVDAGDPRRIFAAGLAYHHGGRRLFVARGESRLPAGTQSSAIGPCGFAAFYRKAALDMVGGMSPELGLAQADADVALALARAGLACAVEPQSRILATAQVEASETSFRQALHEERLFWRNLPETGRCGAMAAHAAVVAVESIRNFLRPAMFLRMAGRSLACCQVGSYVRRRAALRQLGEHAAAAPQRLKPTRIDRSHKGPSLSRSAQTGARAR